MTTADKLVKCFKSVTQRVGHTQLTLQSVPRMDVPFLKLIYSGVVWTHEEFMMIANKWDQAGTDMIKLDGMPEANKYMKDVITWCEDFYDDKRIK